MTHNNHAYTQTITHNPAMYQHPIQNTYHTHNIIPSPKHVKGAPRTQTTKKTGVQYHKQNPQSHTSTYTQH